MAARKARKTVFRYEILGQTQRLHIRELPNGASERKPVLDAIIEGDAREELKKVGESSVDLVVTSPPYADSRKRTYGGIHPDEYVEWFLPFGRELFAVLK